MDNFPEQTSEIESLEREHLERFHAIRDRLLGLQGSERPEIIEEMLAMNAFLIEFAEERLAAVIEKEKAALNPLAAQINGLRND